MEKGKYHFTLFKRKNGSNRGIWYYYCYDGQGKRIKRSTGETTRKGALEIVMQRVVSGTIVDEKLLYPSIYQGDLRFKDFVVNFYSDDCPICKDKALRGKPYTPAVIKGERQRLDTNIKPFLGEYFISQITISVLKKWQLWLREEKGLSNATINRSRNVLMHVLDYAVELGLIPANPLMKVKPLYVDSVSNREAYTKEEIALLFEDSWNNKIAELACYTSALTGMRMGEIRALRGQNIKPDMIVISNAVDHNTGTIKSTKSGKSRVCPITKELYERLKPFIRGEDDWVFSLNGKTPVAASYITKGLNARIDQVGIRREGLCFHSFRHFFNSRLIGSGVQGELVRAVIGHESERMTDRYLHLNESGDFDAIRKVQERLMK